MLNLGAKLRDKKEWNVKTSLLEQYEQLNYVTEQMLINARDENWDLLLTWQAKYHQLTKAIMQVDDLTAVDKIPLKQKDIFSMYIKNIHSYQQQISQLIIYRHAQLKELIGEQVDYQTKLDSYQKIASLI